MITAVMVKELREKTGAGMMDCKKALTEANGDMEKAIETIKERGLAVVAKKAGRIAAEGLVEAYIHGGGRIGVLVEVNCETDFVAKTAEYKEFCRDIAMQVAASSPQFVRREDVPQDVIDQEKANTRAEAEEEGKPANIIEKMVEGRAEKYFKEACLLEQPFIKNTDITVQQLLNEKIAKIGENITIRRFARYQVGEGIEKKECNLAEEIAALTKK